MVEKQICHPTDLSFYSLFIRNSRIAIPTRTWPVLLEADVTNIYTYIRL